MNSKILNILIVLIIALFTYLLVSGKASSTEVVKASIPAQKIPVVNKTKGIVLAEYISKEYKIEVSLATEIVQLVQTHSESVDFPKTELVLAVIAVESRFDPNAVSIAGAKGLMQIMPVHKADGSMEDNIIKGIWVLQTYRGQVGTYYDALIAYNAGIGAFQRGYRNLDYAIKVEKEHKKFTRILKTKF